MVSRAADDPSMLESTLASDIQESHAVVPKSHRPGHPYAPSRTKLKVGQLPQNVLWTGKEQRSCHRASNNDPGAYCTGP